MLTQQHENLNESILYALEDKFFGINTFRTPSTKPRVTKVMTIEINGNNKMKPTTKYNSYDAPACKITPITHPRKSVQTKKGICTSMPWNI
mmetsp:Transcript_4552/g.7895  ORF Transcript_4552/g.7895 Transcript_4552/m.7895 type:complete len:91 (-) Transcript_4552:978-1250(-)